MDYKSFTASGIVSGTRAMLGGFSISASVAAVVNIRDGLDGSAPIVARINVPVTTSQVVSFPHPIACDTAIYVEVASGTVQGSIFYE